MPDLCLHCRTNRALTTARLCVFCEHQIVYFRESCNHKNALRQKLAGRLSMIYISAYLRFQKSGVAQSIMHAFKYLGYKKLGYYFGRQHASKLINDLAGSELEIDYIVPVPLHPKKKRTRGYNQAAEYARGLASILKIPIREDILVRKKYTETQTKMAKFERFNNVATIFHLAQADQLINKHILLVDDVITTGATIESCALLMRRIKGCKLSIATMASAVHG